MLSKIRPLARTFDVETSLKVPEFAERVNSPALPPEGSTQLSFKWGGDSIIVTLGVNQQHQNLEITKNIGIVAAPIRAKSENFAIQIACNKHDAEFP